MKTAFTFSLLALCGAFSTASAQVNGAIPPGYPPGYTPSAPAPTYSAPAAGAGLYGNSGYTPVSPNVPPPSLGSPYTGPTMMQPSVDYNAGAYAYNPAPANNGGGYGYNGYSQQSTPANAWSTMQQSMGTSLLNYSYLEAGYRYIDPRGGSFDGSHGLGVTLVVDLPTIFFVKGSIAWTSGNANSNTVKGAADADYDLSTISIGGGAYMAVTPKFHFVGEIGVVYANFDADGINKSYTDAGVYVRPSVRYQVVDWLELQAGVTVNSTSDFDSKVLDIGGYVRVMPQLDLNLGADFGDENRTMKAGARLRW